jgi:hypothetical protein
MEEPQRTLVRRDAEGAGPRSGLSRMVSYLVFMLKLSTHYMYDT